jgi:uncharacterized DUF497 family protein
LRQTSAAFFDWDDANRCHLARHGVSPAQAEQCYRRDPLVVKFHPIHGEPRYLCLAEIGAGHRLAFVLTIFDSRVRFVTAYSIPSDGPQISDQDSLSHQPIPVFLIEEEEAGWWDAHPEVIVELFQTVRQYGRLRRLSQTDLPRAQEQE